MNPRWTKWAWRAAKALLAVAILAGVGRQFYRDLARPDNPDQAAWSELPLRPGWVVASACLYLMGLACSAIYWYRLLGIFGTAPPFRQAWRAYFIGQLGKYVPGKAWALLLRGGLVAGPDLRLGTAIITAFYEVLTTMATGALIAALIFVCAPPQVPNLAWHPLYTGLLLLGLCGLPLLPGVFNYLTRRLARRFAHIDSLSLRQIQIATLAEGILITGCGWCFMGLSVWSMLQAVLPEIAPLTLDIWATCVAGIGLAYVAGFLAFMLPSGVGVREYFLLQLLAFAGPDRAIAAAVLLLRLTWTSAELILAGVVYFFKNVRKKRGQTP